MLLSYTKLFKEHLGRDPTAVECFDMGQSNSEHSRHWFFSGIIEVDGVAKPQVMTPADNPHTPWDPTPHTPRPMMTRGSPSSSS